MAYGRDRSDRETDLILSIPGNRVRTLYEERSKRHARRAEMYNEAADKMAQAIAAAPKEEPKQYLPEAERAYEGLRTLAVAQAPRENAASYREMARNESRLAKQAALCAEGVEERAYRLTEEEIGALFND